MIRCSTVNSLNDEEVHQVEDLYYRGNFEQPMHPSGARNIPPGQSLSFNVTKRLTVNPDEMLMFDYDLTESYYYYRIVEAARDSLVIGIK